MERGIAELGAEVRAAQDERLAGAIDLAHGRRRLLEASARTARPRRWPALAGATALAALGVWLVSAYRGAPPSFQIGTKGGGAAGNWIAAPAEAGTPLRFADGTELVLMPGARSMVEGTRAAPRVVVERGEIHASVVPHVGRRWRVDAGPFRVIVTGTRFDLGWDPDRERFSIALHEGKVLVSGPTLGDDRPVTAGETLRVSPRDDELRLRTGAAADDDEPGAVAAAPTVAPAETERDKRVQRSADVPSAFPRAGAQHPAAALRGDATAGAQAAGFAGLARENRYADALAAAEAAGFTDVCGTASAPDLLLLGDAARLAGSPARAQTAYAAVRERFTGAPAAHATFLLGRLVLDERGQPAAAARLFESYLRDHADGPFAREASGLLAEARHRAGDRAGARAAAADYLERYPDGPFAPRARALQGSE